MKLYELKERASLSASLIEIWEASVRATHLFLSDAEIKHIKEYVPEALNAVEHLIIAENEWDVPVGFMGVETGYRFLQTFRF